MLDKVNERDPDVIAKIMPLSPISESYQTNRSSLKSRETGDFNSRISGNSNKARKSMMIPRSRKLSRIGSGDEEVKSLELQHEVEKTGKSGGGHKKKQRLTQVTF